MDLLEVLAITQDYYCKITNYELQSQETFDLLNQQMIKHKRRGSINIDHYVLDPSFILLN